MELGSAEEQPNKCQNHNRTKIKSGIDEQQFFNPTFINDLIFGKKKLKKPTCKLACQFDIFKPIFKQKKGQLILGYDTIERKRTILFKLLTPISAFKNIL